MIVSNFLWLSCWLSGSVLELKMGRCRVPLIVATALLANLGLQGSTPALGDGAPVIVATYEGVINPVAAEYLHDALAFAESSRAQALIVKLDTPGGLDTSMRLIIKDFTNASVPVVVYVSPSGGRAASAGVFITMAAHVAAMAPGTNIGAAHPVAMGGGEMDKTMKEKVENDSVSYLKSIAQERGRNVQWAEDAVRKSVSATEKEALALKVIDIVAEDVPALLTKLDGRTVTLASGPVTLHTRGVEVREFPMGWRLEALKVLSDPNIAMMLMTIGVIGILAELYNPGAILPGVVGAISLILAFYSLQSLPINYAGVALIILGIVFFILELTVPSYGLLTLGGIAAMTLGGLLLVKTEAPFLQVSLSFLLPTMVTVGAMVLAMMWLAVRARQRAPVTGRESMIGQIAVARTDVAPHGQVFIHGELWDAVSEAPIRAGEPAEIKAVEGLTLKVAPHRK
jgi:membrane-bound serine protease (ClpP class)